MKRKLKGLLSLLLAVMMVLTAMPITFAEGDDTDSSSIEIKIYTGAEALVKGNTPDTDALTLRPNTDGEHAGEYSFIANAEDIIFTHGDPKLLAGWKLWTAVAETGAVNTCDKYAWDEAVTADALTAEAGQTKVLEPVWSVCEITEEPTAGNPAVDVTDAAEISYQWYTATVSESDVTLGEAVEGQTTKTLTVTPVKGNSYACEITLTGEAGDEVTLTSEAVTFEEVTITFYANGGDGTMGGVAVLSGTKYELPECGFEAPSNDQLFAGWTVAPTAAELEAEEDEEEIVIYEPGDEIVVEENTTVSAVWAEQVATPVISPSSNTIYSTTAISIECDTEDAEIYYTLDGTTPTTSSTKYTRSFAARTHPTVVKAIAVKDGMADSEVATKQYAVMSFGLGGSSTGGVSGGYGGGSSSFSVKFDTNGGLTIATQYINKNGYVKEPENPTKYGFEFIGWYTDKALTEEYDFDTKVTSSFTLYAKWEGGNSVAPSEDKPFDDVNDNDWFSDDVIYAYDNGLINGMADREFGPAIPLNRAMLVTILYRIEGSPAVSGISKFTDIEPGAYYEKAVMWAEENAIVNGMTETEFGPTLLITREQFATILYRYAGYKGYLSDAAASIGIIAPDADSISDWALEAMSYCVESKIISGYEDGTINPKGNTTRAEAAAMLRRFVEAN